MGINIDKNPDYRRYSVEPKLDFHPASYAAFCYERLQHDKDKCAICGKPIDWHWKQTCSSTCGHSFMNYVRAYRFCIKLHEKELAKGSNYDASKDPFHEPAKCPICGKYTPWTISSQRYQICCCRSHHISLNRRQATQKFHENRRQQMIESGTYDRYKDKLADAPICIVEGCNNETRWHKCAMSWSLTCPNCKKYKPYLTGWFNDLKHCINKSSVYYDSSYEYSFMLKLEELQIDFEHEPLRIYWNPGNIKRYYIPDYVVHYKGKLLIIELKPSHQIWLDHVKAKAKLAIDFVNSNPQYHCYAFLTEHEVYDIQAIQQTLDNLIESGKCKYIEQLNL